MTNRRENGALSLRLSANPEESCNSVQMAHSMNHSTERKRVEDGWREDLVAAEDDRTPHDRTADPDSNSETENEASDKCDRPPESSG